MINQIYNDDCLNILSKIEDNAIDCIITSPPYNFNIEYDNYNDNKDINDYFNYLYKIFNECIRVLKSSGRFIINIQPIISKNIPTHHIITNYLINKGLFWKGEIIWEKNNYNCAYTCWGSYCSPSAPYLKYSWEFVEVFYKDNLKKNGNKEYIDITKTEFEKFVYAKWNIKPSDKNNIYEHNAMMPEELAYRLIKLFTYRNDIVLDPFNRTGTITKIAKLLCRKYIGIDISNKYCKIARERLSENILL